jgi:hypothetical protein
VSEQCADPKPGLEVHTVEDGVVVFDADTDRVHYLNPTATFVFSLADGNRTGEEIAELVREAWNLDAAPVEEVTSCIEQLRREGVFQ